MAGRLSSLTQREKEVLEHVSAGLSCRAIAETLGLSVATVKTHRRNMFGKLGVRNAAQLIELARQEQYLPRVPQPQQRPRHLSPREEQVMQLVIQGLTSKQIARHLGIEVATIRKHRERLLRKLGLKSSAQLSARYG